MVRAEQVAREQESTPITPRAPRRADSVGDTHTLVERGTVRESVPVPGISTFRQNGFTTKFNAFISAK